MSTMLTAPTTKSRRGDITVHAVTAKFANQFSSLSDEDQRKVTNMLRKPIPRRKCEKVQNLGSYRVTHMRLGDLRVCFRLVDGRWIACLVGRHATFDRFADEYGGQDLEKLIPTSEVLEMAKTKNQTKNPNDDLQKSFYSSTTTNEQTARLFRLAQGLEGIFKRACEEEAKPFQELVESEFDQLQKSVSQKYSTLEHNLDKFQKAQDVNEEQSKRQTEKVDASLAKLSDTTHSLKQSITKVISKHDALADDHKSKIATLQNTVTQLATTNTELNDCLVSTQSQVGALKQQCNDLQLSLQHERDANATTQSQVGTLKQQCNDLQLSLQHERDANASVRAIVDGLNTKVEEHTDYIERQNKPRRWRLWLRNLFGSSASKPQ